MEARDPTDKWRESAVTNLADQIAALANYRPRLRFMIARRDSAPNW
jgi:hypothetical protein